MADQAKRALEHLSAQRYEQAWSSLERATPETPYLKALKGRALVGLERWDEAKQYLDAAITEDSGCAEAVAGRGLLWLNRGELETAEQDLDLAVKLQPGVGRFHGWRGIMLAQLGRLDEAQKELETSYRLGERDPELLLTRARIHAAHNRGPEALQTLELAESQGADQCQLQWARAWIHENAEKPQEALAHYRKALDSDPSYPKLWLAYLRLVSSADRPNLLSVVEESLTHHPDHEQLLSLVTLLYLEVGQPKAGLPYLRAAQQRRPKSSKLLVLLGDLHRASGSRVQASVSYEKALELDPRSAEAWFGKGKLSKPKEATICFRKAVSHAPDRAQYYQALGSALAAQELHSQAVSAFKIALKLQPDNEELSALRAASQEHLPEDSEAQSPGLNQSQAATAVEFLIHRALDTFHTLLPNLRQDPIWGQLDQEGFAQFAGLYASALPWLFFHEIEAELRIGYQETELLESLDAFHSESRQDPRSSLCGWLRANFFEKPMTPKADQGLAPFLGLVMEYLNRCYRGDLPEHQDWQARENVFRQTVSELGAEVQFILNLEQGRYFLVRGSGEKLEVLRMAEAQVLAIYSSRGEFRAGWACPEIDPASRPQPVMGIPPEFPESVKAEKAWALAEQCGDWLEVDTIVTMPNPEALLFLGVRNMRIPEEEGLKQARAQAQAAIETIQGRGSNDA